MQVISTSLFTLQSPLAHGVDAQWCVGQQGSDINVVAAFCQRLQILRKALPGPGQTLVQGCIGNVLHAFHQFDQGDTVFGAAGRKADATITHDCSGNALLRGRPQALVPGGLAIKVRVYIHKARRDHKACGIYGVTCISKTLANGCNAAILDGDIGDVGGCTSAIHHLTIANQNIKFRHFFSLRFMHGLR